MFANEERDDNNIIGWVWNLGKMVGRSGVGKGYKGEWKGNKLFSC